MIFQKNNSFNAAFLYGILNICTFFGFDKSQSIETFERFTLQTQLNKKQIKLDTSCFINSNSVLENKL